MYWWYRIVHVHQTLNYTNLTTAPKCKKPNLNLCMCARVGVWDGCCSNLHFVKHPIFTNISWDFDDLSTKNSTCSIQCWSSKHLPAGCTLDGNVIVTDQKDTLLLRVASPSPRNNWGPRCVLFPLLLCVGKFFFTRAGQVFFSFPCGTSFFFSFYVWVNFFFFYPWVGKFFFFFFFFTQTSAK